MAEQQESTGVSGQQEGGGPLGLGSGELMVVIGAALIFVMSFVLFQVILRDYTVFQMSWMAALGALVAVWLRQRDPGAWSVPYGTILLVLAWIVVANQVYSVIVDLRAGFDYAAEVIAALAAYAGAALMLIGSLRLTGKV